MENSPPHTTPRMGRDENFMLVAHVVALRSTCLRAQVGALVVLNNHIISTGYNGAPRGLLHCTPATCNSTLDHCRATVHAEANALLQAGPQAEGSTLYCTHMPCPVCSRLIINAGIRRVVFDHILPKEADRSGMKLLRLANIFVHQVTPKEITIP